MPTKILHLINGEHYAGAERVQDLLAVGLEAFGYESSFACLKEGIFAQKRKARGAALHNVSEGSALDLSAAYRLARLAMRDKVQIIHTHTRRSALVGQLASLISGVPMVHHVHSPSDRDTEDRWRNVRNGMIEKLSLLRARKLIAVSRSLAEYLEKKGYERQRIRTVWNGVPILDKRRRTLVGSGPFVVGVVALFRPRKGIETLLKALALLVKAGHDARLHAVGPFEKQDYQASVARLVGKLGLERNVQWVGFTGDVAAEFAEMHVFAVPSLFGEGLPMVLLEAMSAGLPVVGTSVEGIPEVIRDGVDGLLVAPGDSEQLAAALLKFLTGSADPEHMGDCGRERQRELFSDVAMARGVADVYDEVLRGGRV